MSPFPISRASGGERSTCRLAEIEHAVAYQIGAAQALARLAGHEIGYVKAHGALANLAERDAKVAQAIADAVAKVDARLTLLAIARSEQGPAADAGRPQGRAGDFRRPRLCRGRNPRAAQ